MKGHDEGLDERFPDQYRRTNEKTARMVAYLGPYIFWGSVVAIVGGILLLQ